MRGQGSYALAVEVGCHGDSMEGEGVKGDDVRVVVEV